MFRARTLHSYVLGRALYLTLAAIVVAGLLLAASPPFGSRASALGPCTVVSLDPHQAPDGSVTDFAFTVMDNNDSVAWIRVTSPSANLSIVNANSSWLPNTSTASDHADFYGDAIAPGNQIQFSVSASVSMFPPDNWTVEASTDSGGSNPFTCGGDTSVSAIDTTPPNITSISASALTTTASIHWTTDKLTTGTVSYGPDTSYGLQATDSTVDTSHSVSLTGLTPSTTYHYQITAVDQSSNTTVSTDGTFTTATPSSGGTNGGGGGGTINVIITNPADKTPPSISFTSTLPRVFTSAPTVSGKADDNDQVARIEYSTDGGENWLPVDTATGIGTKHATFSFTPVNLRDDTYIFIARAFDAGGNSASTDAITAVVDRFPPVVGGSVIALGPQVLVANADSVVTTLPKVNLDITTSATGGASEVAINAMAMVGEKTTLATSFSLQQAHDSGLWSGVLSFSEPGLYSLVAHGRDGAENTTTRAIGLVRVMSPGRVLSANGPISRAVVTAYYRDPDTNNWTQWDSRPYDQLNPQATSPQGSFQMFLPAGTYYLHVEANGYQSVNTTSFTLSQPTPLTTVIRMNAAFGIGPVHVPWFNFSTQPMVSIRSDISNLREASDSLIGKPLPVVTLKDITGAGQNSISWLGKPTVVTLLSTWAPAASEQMAFLSHLSDNHDLNTEVIGLQENAARLRAYNAISGTSLHWLADPDSQSVAVLNSGSMPQHYFVDREGIVREVIYGTLTYEQLLEHLTNLP